MERRIDTAERVGEVVRDRRHQLGLTQTQLAGAAGTTLRVLSEIENGKATVQLDTLMRLLRALGLELVARTR